MTDIIHQNNTQLLKIVTLMLSESRSKLPWGMGIIHQVSFDSRRCWKKRSGPYWISRNTGSFFCFNSSLSDLYNNVIIYTIKKVVRTVLFVNEFTEFSYSCYKGIRYSLRWNSWLQNDRDIRLLIIFLTVYTCITFHFFALALGEKGVFYSYKKISMLFEWYKIPTMLLEKVSIHTEIIIIQVFFIITCSFSVFVENCILLPKGINELLCSCVLYMYGFDFLPFYTVSYTYNHCAGTVDYRTTGILGY
jgi:hypothetical protein